MPKAPLWDGFTAEEFGYDEEARLETKRLFDVAELFIITLGLSELWFDEVTGEVFWRQPPKEKQDPARHKFRVASYDETLDNLRAIRRLIRANRPDAAIVFAVSPIPLEATFRGVSCLSASSVSKAILRAAVDQLHREERPHDPRLYYFPSYEIVKYAFNHQWTEDRRHVHTHVLEFNMMTFEHYFCVDGLDKAALLAGYHRARELDERVRMEGHSAVPKASEAVREARVQKRREEAEKIREARRQERIEARSREPEAPRRGLRWPKLPGSKRR